MSSPTETKDIVLMYLRMDKIKLWLPPYRNLITQGGGSNHEALSELAESLDRKIKTSPIKGTLAPKISKEEVYNVLIELQSHAVEKLKVKNPLNIKILGTTLNSDTDTTQFSSWGEVVNLNTSDDQDSSRVRLLRVTNLSPTLTLDKFILDISCAFNATNVHLIWKGKSLLSNKSDDTLRKIITEGNNSGSKLKKKSELLCLVSGYDSVASAASTGSMMASSPDRTASAVIANIRQAANKIQSLNGGARRFELTDQNGNLVPMQRSDTVAFVTALGLHRIGRSKMEERNNDNSNIGREAVSSALVFLLESDAEWNNSAAFDSWKIRVDNYGLLQLDIAWCYLLLESLDNLTDAVARLDIAEKTLKKQMYKNFVPLAIAQAELNNPIPPLTAIFVRLFLLQGVAKKMLNCNETANEKLSDARLLCNRLRSSSPQDLVENISNTYYINPSTAIAALRKANGDPNAAANIIASDREEEEQAAKKRHRQHKIGKCANGVDHVNLDLFPIFCNLLGYGDIDIQSIQRNDELPTSALIVISLLRLSNNEIDKALELYKSIDPAQIVERCAQLDEVSGKNKRKATIRSTTSHGVKDVDLMMLISMGVNEGNAREALRATGNVDCALLWLSFKETTASNRGNHEEHASATVGNGNSASESSTANNNHDTTAFESRRNEIDDAHALLERELGNALNTNSKELLEKEWLGADLNEEWDLLGKYYSYNCDDIRNCML